MWYMFNLMDFVAFFWILVAFNRSCLCLVNTDVTKVFILSSYMLTSGESRALVVSYEWPFGPSLLKV